MFRLEYDKRESFDSLDPLVEKSKHLNNQIANKEKLNQVFVLQLLQDFEMELSGEHHAHTKIIFSIFSQRKN